MKKVLILFIALLVALSACQSVGPNTPAPIYDTGLNPDLWVSIPAGSFLSGQFDEEAVIDYDYEIMVTDVTNAQYAEFLNSALADSSIKINGQQVVGEYEGEPFDGGRHEVEIAAGDYVYLLMDDEALRMNFTDTTFSAKDEWANHPMTMVSWFGANAYCAYYGWELPSELEWEKAARGSDNRPFPWGETISHENANYIASRDPFEDMSSFGSRTTPVGFFNGQTYDGFSTIDSKSPYGLYDMAGNVWQWTRDNYESQHYRYMRGGSANMYPNQLRIWQRNSATPTFYSPFVGFRCVKK